MLSHAVKVNLFMQVNLSALTIFGIRMVFTVSCWDRSIKNCQFAPHKSDRVCSGFVRDVDTLFQVGLLSVINHPPGKSSNIVELWRNLIMYKGDLQ
jgi:hypothetical protein